MKIAVIGATGNIGSRIVDEALRRGHEVTAIARDPSKLTPQPGLIPARGDVHDKDGIAALVSGHDAVISSLKFQTVDPAILIAAVKQAGVKRLLVVGGAASLEVAPGVQLFDTPNFPAPYKPEAAAGREFLQILRAETELEWTFLSPSAEVVPGERTGKFRLGKDELLVMQTGESKISMEDYAVALIDELENPEHIRERFTVGY